MHVFVVGGTGFLGYHIIHEFLRRGHSATALALPPMPQAGLFPPAVEVQLADLNTLANDKVQTLVRSSDAVVYAAGVDDRSIPNAPAYRFFYEGNVRSTARFFHLARKAGVKRGILLSSYFLHFDRVWPHLKLSERHPYIWSRKAQAEHAFHAAAPSLALMVLELGYIFGSMPGRTPLWKPIIDYVRSPLPLFYPQGGTNMIAAARVAEAVVGALECGEGGKHYTIGGENLTWAEWLQRLGALVGKHKHVISLPNKLVRIAGWGLRVWHSLCGKESGLDPVAFMDIQAANTFFDPTPSQVALGYTADGLDEALAQTVKACLSGR